MYRKTALILIGILSFWATTAQTTAKEWYENGLKLFDAKKYSEAVISFDKAAGLNPQYDAAWYRAGWCYNDLEQYSKALERLKKAVEVNKRYHQAYQEMGYAYRKLNMYEQALSSLNSAIAIRSDYAMAYKQKGDVYKEMNKSTEAIETYKKCLEYDSQNESVLFNIGYLYNGLADYDNAIVWLRKATAVKQTAATYNEIGFAYYKQKMNDSAIANYRNALRIAPNNGTAYKGIGDVYRRNYSPARTDDAMESYKKAIQHNPNSAGSHFGLGWCYNEKGNYTESVPYLQKALSLDNGMVAAYTEMGYAQYMTGKNYEAIETFKKGVGIDAKNTLCRYYAGLVYLKLKDKTKAIDMCNGLRPLDGQLADKLLAKINAL